MHLGAPSRGPCRAHRGRYGTSDSDRAKLTCCLGRASLFMTLFCEATADGKVNPRSGTDDSFARQRRTRID